MNSITPRNEQRSRYVFSKVVECFEKSNARGIQNIHKQIDDRKSSNINQMNRVQNIRRVLK